MKFVSENALVARLRELPGDEPRAVVSGNFATPLEILSLLDQSRESFRLFVLNAQTGWPQRDGVITETPFVGPGTRHDPHLEYIPMRLSLVPRLFAYNRRPDAVLLQTSIPRNGKVSLGVEVNILPAALEEVKRRGGLVVAQVNSQMPYTYGDAELNVDDIDVAISVDRPLLSPPARMIDSVALRIGENVATLARDASTLQMGIGQVPDAALSNMHSLRDLGVWSEMISDGVLSLETSGALDRARPVVTTFLFGSSDLYEWANENPRLRMLRTETVNDPARIAQQPQMLSINTALQIDLYAQANASYVRGIIYSGYGGQPDFVSGAVHSSSGQSVLALRSMHEKSATSNVVSLLPDPTCSFQHSVVVSENGLAPIFGLSQSDQARLLIEAVAHPSARRNLEEGARELKLF